MTVEWLFLCESVDFGPDGEIVSIHRILRPHSGLAARVLPCTVTPMFVMSLHGEPEEGVTFHTTITEESPSDPFSVPPVIIRLPLSGTAEIGLPCPTITFLESGTFTFTLWINGNIAFTTQVPVQRSI